MKSYTKPTLKKYGYLKSVTFSSDGGPREPDWLKEMEKEKVG